MSIPTKELSNIVCEYVNKNAGIPFPNSPTISKGYISFLLTFLIDLKIKGDRERKAIKILIAATCISLNVKTPLNGDIALSISINELPQISDKNNRIKKCL